MLSSGKGENEEGRKEGRQRGKRERGQEAALRREREKERLMNEVTYHENKTNYKI